MLFITFKAGDNRYALEARRIVEIVPRVLLQPWPNAPRCMAGLCNYRGASVPVIDLCCLFGGGPCGSRLSTRIVITPFRQRDDRQRLIGLLAEEVTDTLIRRETDFAQDGLADEGAPALAKLAVDTAGFIRRVQPEELLPAEWDPLLFGRTEAPV